MGSRPARHRYCRCGTHLAADNIGRQCARCQRVSRDKLIAPPQVPAEFWHTEQFRATFAAQHIGRVSRAYRTHPYHHTVYGPEGITQTLLGQWLGLSQPQISRIEGGAPIRNLDTLVYWARILRIPAELLWFKLPNEQDQLATTEPAVSTSNSAPESPAGGVLPASDTSDEHADDPEHDPVLITPWNHPGTVKVAIVLSGGDGRVKRRVFLSLTGPALTAPAHQWLVHEPEPLVSGLAGRRVSGELVGRLGAIVTELRRMDDVAGGGSVLAMAEQAFAWVARLLDRASYDEHTGRALHVVLAELGQLCGWSAWDAGHHALAQRYNIAGLRAAHSADDQPLGAHILASLAHQAGRGQPAEAATLIETALAGTRGRATPALLAELHIRHAEALGTLRDTSGCMAAISQARTQVAQLKPDDDPPWLYWMDRAAITVDAGECLLRLGQPDQAVTVLHEGIAQLPESFVRDRQIVVTHLADALARPGKQRDLEDAAARLGMQSIDLVESLDSHRGTDSLRDLYFRMQPYVKVLAVQDFVERARGFVESR